MLTILVLLRLSRTTWYHLCELYRKLCDLHRPGVCKLMAWLIRCALLLGFWNWTQVSYNSDLRCRKRTEGDSWFTCYAMANVDGFRYHAWLCLWSSLPECDHDRRVEMAAHRWQSVSVTYRRLRLRFHATREPTLATCKGSSRQDRILCESVQSPTSTPADSTTGCSRPCTYILPTRRYMRLY